jgi:hypothetical protein
MIGLVGVLVLVVAGFLGYGQFFAGHPKEPPHPATVGKPLPPAPAAPVPAPSEAVQTPVEAGAAVEANLPAPTRKVGPPPPASLKRPVPAAPDPSLQFRTFVDHLKGAVRVGPPTRLNVGGLSFRPGEVVDQKLGIVFVGLDADTKELIFEEPSGARIRRLF